MKLLNILLSLTLLAFTGCKKYLEEEPTRQASIQTTDQLEALINNANVFCFDGGYYSYGSPDWTAGYSTDDTEIPMAAYRAHPDAFSLLATQYHTFKIQELVSAPSDDFYKGAYRQIFNANVVLTYADNVTGDQNLKNELKADAHFIRGYCYWVLANHYCLPYKESNAQEAGLVLKTKTDFDEPLERSTLKATYDFILADFQEAAKTSRDDVDPVKPWRVSKKAIDAFLSRFYLYTGNYDQSLIHTNNALGSVNAKLMDLHALQPGKDEVYTNPDEVLKNSELNQWPYSKVYTWKEFYMPRFSSLTTQWWVPSANLIALFDQSNDLRYKWFMVPNGNRRFGFSDIAVYRYTFFRDGSYIPTGPSVPEMLLNKAEILARKGQVADAITTVNLLREKRMNTAAPLSAADKDEAIKKILEERRRELPFMFRWYDIRRFSVNDYPADDVTVTRTFFKVKLDAVDVNSTETVTLAPGSRRYALPINGVEIQNSKGVIKQNQY